MKKRLPAESAAGAVPAIQMPPSLPLGTRVSTLVCASVSALKAITHDVYGRMSQCGDHAVKIVAPICSRPGSSYYILGRHGAVVQMLGWKRRVGGLVLSAVAGYCAVMVIGLPKSGSPVARSNACRRWK